MQEVNQLLTQFEQTQKMMKMVAKGGMQKMMRGLKGAFPGPALGRSPAGARGRRLPGRTDFVV